MKKENREMAKKRRAEERRKQERNGKIKKGMLYGIPVALACILIIWVVAIAVSERNATVSDTTGSDTTETVADSSTSESESSTVVADGDTVNIDYVGSIDGVEFDGGNTNGAGTDLTIGSGTYIDDFEEQLIGHSVGETVSVEVTFPDDYGNEELNGKDAVFEVTINSIE